MTAYISELAQRIHQIIEKERTLGITELKYINSTFLNPSIQEVQKWILDLNNSDGLHIRALFCFPDEWMQLQIEEYLQKYKFSKTDEIQVSEMVIQLNPRCILRHPVSQDILQFQLNPHEIAQWVSRLHIPWQCPLEIQQALFKHIQPENKIQYAVKLRNMQFKDSPDHIFILCSFFKSIAQQGIPDGIPYLECLLEMFEETDITCENIVEELYKKRNALEHRLHQGLELQEKQLQDNWETLLMRGQRFIHVDIEKLSYTIHCIDVLISCEVNCK
ncbi:MAG: hypothetical protein HQK77_21750 [Desulfobacterales bacterium]|nr:hypothetical protein [Desulfobacterales bacterium]